MGWLTVDAVWEDESTGCTSVLTEEREVAAHDVFCTLLIVLIVSSLGIAVEGCSGDGTPIMGIDISVGLTLTEPVAVPMTDGYLR